MLETNTLSQLHLFYPLLFIFAIIVTFVLSKVYKDKLDNRRDIQFKDKDVEITSEAFKGIGEVKDGPPNVVSLNLQNVENNKEIYLHDKKIDELEEKVELLLNENGDLRATYKILQSKFDALTKIVGREI